MTKRRGDLIRVLREPELAVAYRLIEGDPMRDEDVAGVAAFLSALHAFDPDGAPVERPDWRSRYEEQCVRFRRTVAPLLDREERRRAERLFVAVESVDEVAPVLVHADLGREHLLCRCGRLVGVIDWADAVVGDAALDFAWLLHGHPGGPEILAAYAGRVDETFAGRALFYRRLAPWYEADYGLLRGRQASVQAGLAGIRARLP